MSAPLDLRGYACPMTYVKTRIALERLPEGAALEVWLPAGEPAASVPRSAEEEGHEVDSLAPLPGDAAGAVRLVLRKGAPRPEPF